MVVALVALQNPIEVPPIDQGESRRSSRVTIGGVDAHSVIDLPVARRLILSKVRDSATTARATCHPST